MTGRQKSCLTFVHVLSSTDRALLPWLTSTGGAHRHPSLSEVIQYDVRDDSKQTWESGMAGGIFLLHDGGGLVEMTETAYESEALLQELLATHPSLLAGDQFSSAIPRRWLLISREVGLASEEGGGSRWSVDHVFLDQDAVPTLVEVKRSTDTDIRRKVVGQMLDYAANAVVYWPIETMQAQFERACARQGRDIEQVLDDFLGVDGDAETFWQQAKSARQ